MPGDVAGGPISPHVGAARFLAVVDHVAQELTGRILGAGRAQVSAEAPEDEGRVFLAPALHGKPA